MTKVKEFVGIDISKLTFDVASPSAQEGKYKHSKYANNPEGFAFLKQIISANSICIMEASGPYYMP